MLNIKGFNARVSKSKFPFWWDIANPLLPLRIQIEKDVSQFKELIEHYQWETDLNYNKLLANGYTIVITNLEKEIIWVSSNFFFMTGYLPEEAIGNKPSLLQGVRTSKKQIWLINEKLQRLEVIKASLINYKKDNEPYICEIKIYPVKNTAGQVTHFLAIEKSKDE